MNIVEILNKVDNLVWGAPLLILLMGTGIYLTVKLGLLQITKLPLALKYLFQKDKNSSEEGDVSSFAALCTALSATIGTGNIVGVATAIKLGGPGALFWMWMAAFFGMATKYAEGLLAIKFRVKDENGQMSGGPMYYIERGLGKKWLAKAFALFGIGSACFGMGTFAQVNSITSAMDLTFNISPVIVGIIITILVALITLGGIKSISKVAEVIVPFMAALYIVGSLIIFYKWGYLQINEKLNGIDFFAILILFVIPTIIGIVSIENASKDYLRFPSYAYAIVTLILLYKLIDNNINLDYIPYLIENMSKGTPIEGVRQNLKEVIRFFCLDKNSSLLIKNMKVSNKQDFLKKYNKKSYGIRNKIQKFLFTKISNILNSN